jgi:hypothetical protein
MYSDFFQSPAWYFARSVIVPVRAFDIPPGYAPDARADANTTEAQTKASAMRGTGRF